MGVKIGSRRGSIMARSFSAGICQTKVYGNYYKIYRSLHPVLINKFNDITKVNKVDNKGD